MLRKKQYLESFKQIACTVHHHSMKSFEVAKLSMILYEFRTQYSFIADSITLLIEWKTIISAEHV